MNWLKAAVDEILTGAKKAIQDLDETQVETMIKMLLEAKDKKIFVVGMGRSGFIGRAFALRLMNLGFNVFFLGETITPAAGRDDLVIAISGTGMTKLVVSAASAAKEIGARVIVVTSYEDSQLGQMADQLVLVRGRTKMGWPREEDYLARQIMGEREPLSPLGSVFENNSMIFLDGLVVELMYRMKKNETDLKTRHATIE